MMPPCLLALTVACGEIAADLWTSVVDRTPLCIIKKTAYLAFMIQKKCRDWIMIRETLAFLENPRFLNRISFGNDDRKCLATRAAAVTNKDWQSDHDDDLT